ncbi:hypothetical protein [uncultured Kriegella sp.]|uniref:hypothetical protein n=1 Tax=uncultured Kriegella sp. TaxID=1798910 RepID=UPI0030DC8417|tara:strand:+ start:16137 stop:17153 length:1017 start_codon:yes stop_codon:yes gene_type:complete
MKRIFKITIVLAITATSGFVACSNDQVSDPVTDDGSDSIYSGTASVTQGLATTTTTNLFASGTRVAGLGTIKATDDTTWIVPAAVNYTDNSFPFASDLHNTYGETYTSATDALAALDGNDIVEIDSEGEVITAFVFADNYFEMYVNGVPVGKDPVPFTEFNSSIVRFKVAAPYTIAMKLVDWEENLGLGSEGSGGSAYHPGDGGMVAVFKDESDEIVAITGDDWKAQTFYTAPIKDLSCPTEEGTTRSSDNCDTADSNDGTSHYGLHWEIPSNWYEEAFDDSTWPDATTYTNNTIGVNNKPSYTNFTDIFDDNANDAEFIWSTNVILDNEVIVRYTVE